jgi:hypothetical protein
MKTLIRAIVCRMGGDPIVEEIEPTMEAAHRIVGGRLDCMLLAGEGTVGRGIDLWCNDDAIELELPANRILRIPGGIFMVLGDFFVCAHDSEATVSLNEREIEFWLPLLQRAPVGLATAPDAKA